MSDIIVTRLESLIPSSVGHDWYHFSTLVESLASATRLKRLEVIEVLKDLEASEVIAFDARRRWVPVVMPSTADRINGRTP